MEEHLRQRGEIREEKALLQRLLSIAATVDKVESLLGIKKGSSGSRNAGAGTVARSASDTDRDKLFERVAVCYLLFPVVHFRHSAIPLHRGRGRGWALHLIPPRRSLHRASSTS